MSIIDLSAAPVGAQVIAEEKFNAELQSNALAQLLSIINQGREQLPGLQREAIELLQMEGIAVAVEFLAQQAGISDNQWVKLLRTQIVEDKTRRIREATEAEQAQAQAPAETNVQQGEAQNQALTNVTIGYSPEATAENAGAIRTAMLMGFVQLSQSYPDTAIEPEVARVARQWLPGDDDGDDADHRPA